MISNNTIMKYDWKNRSQFLKNDNLFICVSFEQPHDILQNFPFKMIIKIVGWFYGMYLPNPSNKKSIFRQIITGVNSKFSFL